MEEDSDRMNDEECDIRSQKKSLTVGSVFTFVMAMACAVSSMVGMYFIATELGSIANSLRIIAGKLNG